MEILEISKSKLIQYFNCNYIIEDFNYNIILNIEKLKHYNNIIYCRKIDRDNKHIILY